MGLSCLSLAGGQRYSEKGAIDGSYSEGSQLPGGLRSVGLGGVRSLPCERCIKLVHIPSGHFFGPGGVRGAFPLGFRRGLQP